MSTSAPAATRARHNDDIGIAAGTAGGNSLNGPGVTKDHLFEEYNQSACEGTGRHTAFVPNESSTIKETPKRRDTLSHMETNEENVSSCGRRLRCGVSVKRVSFDADTS